MTASPEHRALSDALLAAANTQKGLLILANLMLKPQNDLVVGVHRQNGEHVGNLKRIGAVWKFKAVGYDAAGQVVPGGGPLTERHNMVFAAPDEALVSAALLQG